MVLRRPSWSGELKIAQTPFPPSFGPSAPSRLTPSLPYRPCPSLLPSPTGLGWGNLSDSGCGMPLVYCLMAVEAAWFLYAAYYYEQVSAYRTVPHVQHC